MASGSSGRPGSGPKGFDFGSSDDILCSYEDYSNQDYSNGSHSDPAKPNNDFQKSRSSRSSVLTINNVYSQPEDSLNSELVTTVDRTMKKYADNLMRFLEGISSRLSQLELYCYNLDKSIGEMRSDLVRDHEDADSKLKSLEKHLQEVNRSVQILRDKQELAETQKELTKLQLTQKESSATGHDERTAVSAAESNKTDVSDSPNTQLALALPCQVASQSANATVQQQAVAPPPPAPSQNLTQVPPYYMPSSQLPNPQAPAHPSYLLDNAQYRAQLTPQGPQPTTQVNQPPHALHFPQYQQQWPQQVSQPPQQPQPQPQSQSQPPPMQQQTQMRPPTPSQFIVYPPYMGGQPANPPPPETMASSMPMQVPFPGMPPQGMSHAEAMPYGYGGANSPAQPQPPSHMKAGFPSQHGDGYPSSGSHPPVSSGGSYMSYDNEGARIHHAPPARYSQGGCPPPNQSLPPPPPPNSNAIMIRGPGPQQFARNHPYNELIDKLVNMGYRGDHVVSVIQRLEESGQPVDFNAVLDRLNGHSSGGYQRGW